MLHFPEEFFQDEEREGFLVSETMKRYWACLMDIVDVIDGICRKHGITYFAHWGTLLGTVRHKGFIPWDDDMDIVLKRPDYERLLAILPEELPEGWWLSSPFTNEEHRVFWAGVSNGKVLDLSKEHLEKTHQCPFVATVDIYPLDYLPRDEQEAQVVRQLYYLIWRAVQLIKDEADAQEIEKAVREVETCLDVEIDRGRNMRSQLWCLANQLTSSYGEADGDCLVHWEGYVLDDGKIFGKHWYGGAEYMPFEIMKLPVPVGYIQALELIYGDWQQRIRGGTTHDYPCFRPQLEFLQKKLKEMKEEQNNQEDQKEDLNCGES